MKSQMKAITSILLEYAEGTEWKRTQDSLITEWREHNRYAWSSARAKHVDFNNAEEGKGFGYFLWKAVRVEADEHGPVDSFLIQFFHVSSSVSFLQIATYMKKVRTDTRCGLSSYFRPYFLLKRSTRPPVSTSFCLPV